MTEMDRTHIGGHGQGGCASHQRDMVGTAASRLPALARGRGRDPNFLVTHVVFEECIFRKCPHARLMLNSRNSMRRLIRGTCFTSGFFTGLGWHCWY